MFRIKFTDPKGIWWTEPLASYPDAALAILALANRGLPGDIWVEDRGLRELYAQLLAAAPAAYLATGTPHVGLAQYLTHGQRVSFTVVRVSDLGPAAIGGDGPRPVAAVFGGYALLDDWPGGAAKVSPCDDELPPELAGPTACQVAAHTPSAISGAISCESAMPLSAVKPPLQSCAADPWWAGIVDRLDRVVTAVWRLWRRYRCCRSGGADHA